MKIVIAADGDEAFTVTVEGMGGRFRREIIQANHDDDGWAGMTKIKEAVIRLGNALGFPVEQKGEMPV